MQSSHLHSGRKTSKFLAVLVVFAAFTMGGRAPTEEVIETFLVRPADSSVSLRDPDAFARSLELVMPRPVVLLTREDAVARELLTRSKTLTQSDALRTAHALCDEARRLNYDPLMFLAVIHVESRYDHFALSPVGAEGLMQLMPDTASWMASRGNLERKEGNTFDPVLNVRLGVRYLVQLDRQFHGMEHALTAYNRGPGATMSILHNHGKLPTQIRDFYATKVLSHYKALKGQYGHLPLG